LNLSGKCEAKIQRNLPVGSARNRFIPTNLWHSEHRADTCAKSKFLLIKPFLHVKHTAGIRKRCVISGSSSRLAIVGFVFLFEGTGVLILRTLSAGGRRLVWQLVL